MLLSMDFVYGPLNQAAVNAVEFVQAGSTVAGPPVTNFIAAHWKINLVYEQILSIKTNLIQISISTMLDQLQHSWLPNPFPHSWDLWLTEIADSSSLIKLWRQRNPIGQVSYERGTVFPDYGGVCGEDADITAVDRKVGDIRSRGSVETTARCHAFHIIIEAQTGRNLKNKVRLGDRTKR